MLEAGRLCCSRLGRECRLLFCTTNTMAWRSHGSDNPSLVERLQENGIVKTPQVKTAMLAVDRGNYAKNSAYQDAPQRIGFNITISAPHMHAHALELLKDHLKPGCRALDVGSGSGYLSVCMAHLVGEEGRVVGIDHIPELVNQSVENIKRDGQAGMLDSGRLSMVVGDGRQGWAAEGPYDCIHVGAAAPTLPQALVDQLKPGGRMVIPVGPEGGDQSLDMVEKDGEGRVNRQKLMGVIYVPLCEKDHQLRN